MLLWSNPPLTQAVRGLGITISSGDIATSKIQIVAVRALILELLKAGRMVCNIRDAILNCEHEGPLRVILVGANVGLLFLISRRIAKPPQSLDVLCLHS